MKHVDYKDDSFTFRIDSLVIPKNIQEPKRISFFSQYQKDPYIFRFVLDEKHCLWVSVSRTSYYQYTEQEQSDSFRPYAYIKDLQNIFKHDSIYEELFPDFSANLEKFLRDIDFQKNCLEP